MNNGLDRNMLRELADRYELQMLVLFGSQASGKTHPKSDTDIGFVSEQKKNMLEVAEMQLGMSRALKIRDLDVVDIRTVSPLFLKNITDNGILLYEKQSGLFAQLRMYAFKRYVETKPLRALRAESLKRFVHAV